MHGEMLYRYELVEPHLLKRMLELEHKIAVLEGKAQQKWTEEDDTSNDERVARISPEEKGQLALEEADRKDRQEKRKKEES